MSSALYITRLRKELRELKKNPVMNIQALPKENNILEWHYVIEGAKGAYFYNNDIMSCSWSTPISLIYVSTIFILFVYTANYIAILLFHNI